MRHAPPSLLRRLVAWVIPPGPAREGLVGDLDELYADRSRNGRTAANLWYVGQLASAVVHYAPRRLSAPWGRGEGTGMVDELRRNVGFAMRALRRRPGFAAVIVLTLALGIGANTAVFSVVRSVVLRPLPFPDDERLMVLQLRMPTIGIAESPPSIPEYVAFRDQMRSWEHLAAYRVLEATVTEGGADPERVSIALATWNLFPALGIAARLGRIFTVEDRTGSDPVAVISHAYWLTRYAGDPQIVGRSLLLDGRPLTIVGVMPAGFGFPSSDVRFWLPLAITPQNLAQRGFHQFTLIGRLAAGATLASAETELGAVMQRVTTDASFNFHDWHPAFLRPLRTQIVGDVSRALWMLLGAVGLVLAIACANVANLMLVRAEERAREMAVRTALGAGRRRLLSQLLTESLLLTAVGALVGVGLAYVGVEALRTVAPRDLPRLEEISVDGVVLAFTLMLTVGVGVLFGLLPAVHVGRADLQGALREEGRSATAGRKRVRLRQALVVSQTALAVVLLISAGLLLQSFRRLMAVDPGYRTDQVLTARLTLPQSSYPEGEDVAAFYQALLPRVSSLPGVSAAGAIRYAPLSIPIGPSNFEVEGWVSPPEDLGPVGVVQVVTPGYFDAMGIPVLEGRSLDAGDRADALPVVVVTESLARSYWPGRSALGGRLRLDEQEAPLAEIVGVVPDVRHNSLDQPAAHGSMFFAHAQLPVLSLTLTVRSAVEPTSLASAIRAEVGALDPAIPVHEVRTMEQAVADASSAQRFTMLLQLLFALVALSLSAVGLYGVLAFTVSRRTMEMGIRLALGAERSNVRRMIVRQGMGIAALAIGIGLAGGLAAGRLLESLLYGTSAVDPLTYAAVVGLLVTVAFVACWIPARRASAIDPIQALRAE